MHGLKLIIAHVGDGKPPLERLSLDGPERFPSVGIAAADTLLSSDGGSLFTQQLLCAWHYATFLWRVGVARWSNEALSPVHMNIHIDFPEAFLYDYLMIITKG